MPGPEYLSVNNVTDVTFVNVEQKTPCGKTIPSSGKVKLITSPLGTSPTNKEVPVLLPVVKFTEPAPPASDAIIIPLTLIGGAITAVVEAAVNLVACISAL
jgi:hypothetical protein